MSRSHPVRSIHLTVWSCVTQNFRPARTQVGNRDGVLPKLLHEQFTVLGVAETTRHALHVPFLVVACHLTNSLPPETFFYN